MLTSTWGLSILSLSVRTNNNNKQITKHAQQEEEQQTD